MRIAPLAAALVAVYGTAFAAEPEPAGHHWQESWLWGIHEHRLDRDTEIIGWRLGPRWYFGHEHGEEDGLALVWRGERHQMSLSEDGVRYTRRF